MEPLEHRLLLSATPVAPDLTTIPNATNLEPNPITQVAAMVRHELAFCALSHQVDEYVRLEFVLIAQGVDVL